MRTVDSSLGSISGGQLKPKSTGGCAQTRPLQYTLHVYSPLGPRLSSFSSSSPSFIGPDPGLGVRMVTWGPGGNWLGVGGYDGKVRALLSVSHDWR